MGRAACSEPGATLPKLELPEGKLVRSVAGGTDSLKKVLVDLKRYSFTGYVKVAMSGRLGSVGYIVLVEGSPDLAIHDRGGKAAEGKVALKSIWVDSYSEKCVIEVHAKIDIEEIRMAYPKAGLEKVRKAVKPSAPETTSPAVARTPSKAGARDAPRVIRRGVDPFDPLDAAASPPDAGREMDAHAREVYDMILAHRQAQGRPADISEFQVVQALEGAPTTRDERTNLIRQYTFDAFVIGPSNRFAHAASAAVAKSPHNAYNPLFITSGPGLGKTHLMNAIGNAILEANPDAKVAYLTVEGFSNEFHEALASNRLASFRERYRSLDVVLIDDAHFLTGKGDVQEELFHTFNDLYNANRQIVLTSDRPPKEISELEDRLVSRFESGLIADIQPPEYDTRVAILRRKARDAGVHVDEEVIVYIGRRVEDNIRELGGALNRVIAFSQLMGQPVSRDLASEVLREPGAPPAGPPGAPKSAVVKIEPGRSYLVEEDRPERAFSLYTTARQEGDAGLVITRSNPNRLREKHNLGAARVLWLTERESAAVETIPPSLERIIYVIEEFMSQNESGAILLDGVEYLVSSSGFDAVLKFLRRLIDHITESRFILLVSASTKTMKEQETKNLEREMEVLSF